MTFRRCDDVPTIDRLVETPQSSIATQYYDPTSVLWPCIRKMSTVVSAVSPVSCVACIPVFPADATTPRHAMPRTRGLLEVWLGLVRFVDEFDATSC